MLKYSQAYEPVTLREVFTVGKHAVNAIAALVATVWATTVIAGIMIHDYTPPPTVHLSMMAIVGALFGRQVLGRVDRDDKPKS